VLFARSRFLCASVANPFGCGRRLRREELRKPETMAILLEERSCRLGRLGSAYQEALETVAAFQHFELLLGLDSFRHDVEPKAVAETDNGVGHGPVVLVRRDVVHEAAIDLEAVERKRCEVGERGIPGSEIIDGYTHT